jgi:membrane protein
MTDNTRSTFDQAIFIFNVIRRTVVRFGQQRAAEAAASMAFFGLFSLFPLILVLVATGSSILNEPQAQNKVLEILMQAFPFSVDIIEDNLQRVLIARGTVQLFGLAVLSWSATGAFSVLTRNINRAWPNAERRNFFKIRMMAFGIMAFVIAVMLFLLTVNTVSRFLPQSLNGLAILIKSLRYFSQFVIFVLAFVTLLWFYRWIPNTTVTWTEAAWGSLIASLGSVIVTGGFSWYLGSGLSNYNLVYGSLGAVVALMFWIFLLSIIILFGAHLSSSIAYYNRIKPEKSTSIF